MQAFKLYQSRVTAKRIYFVSMRSSRGRVQRQKAMRGIKLQMIAISRMFTRKKRRRKSIIRGARYGSAHLAVGQCRNVKIIKQLTLAIRG